MKVSQGKGAPPAGGSMHAAHVGLRRRSPRVTRLLLLLLLLFSLLLFSAPVPAAAAAAIPAGFVEVREAAPSMLLDIRYHGPHNFVGERIDGYAAPRCYLTRAAAAALARVQAELVPFGLSLKIYDGYRPQRAVDHFVRWARDVDDTRTKKEFYPTLDKRTLFRDGYIDARSGHSRGSAVDLTIVPLPAPPEESYTPGQLLRECYRPAGVRFGDNGIDMGTGYDCFHELSHTANPSLGGEQRRNRLLLKALMEKHGFRNFAEEWWHYTLNDEPYPDTYFDFVIE